MTNPEGSFIWYELMTPDPDGAKAFYDAVIGWRIDARPEGEMDYRMIVADDDTIGGVLRLDDRMTAGGARPAWLGYLGVGDVDAKAQAAQDLGGKVIVPPHDLPGVGRFALVTDPAGAPFYLMRGDSPEASHSFAPGRPGHVAWNELSTPDQDKALAFYGDQFGMAKDGAMDMGDMGSYTFLAHGGQQIGAMVNSQPGNGAFWNFYWYVADIDGAVARIAEGGGQVMHGPDSVPGGQRIVIATDPQGAMFSLVGPGDGSGT